MNTTIRAWIDQFDDKNRIGLMASVCCTFQFNIHSVYFRWTKDKQTAQISATQPIHQPVQAIQQTMAALAQEVIWTITPIKEIQTIPNMVGARKTDSNAWKYLTRSE